MLVYRHVMDDVYAMCMMQRYLTPHIKGSYISTFHRKGSVIFVNGQVPLCFLWPKPSLLHPCFFFRVYPSLFVALCAFGISQSISSSLLFLFFSFSFSFSSLLYPLPFRAEGASPKPRCPFPSASPSLLPFFLCLHIINNVSPTSLCPLSLRFPSFCHFPSHFFAHSLSYCRKVVPLHSQNGKRSLLRLKARWSVKFLRHASASFFERFS